MGVAAYNRASKVVSKRIDDAFGVTSSDDLFIRDLNNLPKKACAQRPFSDAIIVQSHGGWFIECPTTGYGFFYKSIRDLVTSWLVRLAVDNGKLVAFPQDRL